MKTYMREAHDLILKFECADCNVFSAAEKCLSNLLELVKRRNTDETRRMADTASLLSVFGWSLLRDPRKPFSSKRIANTVDLVDFGGEGVPRSVLSLELPAKKVIPDKFWRLITYHIASGHPDRVYRLLRSGNREDFHSRFLLYVLERYPPTQHGVLSWRKLAVAWSAVLTCEITQLESGQNVIPHENFDFEASRLSDVIAYVYERTSLKSNNPTIPNPKKQRPAKLAQLKRFDSIAQILLGNEDFIVDFETSTWWSALCALYFYADPREDAIPELFQRATKAYDSENFSTWEQGAQALFDNRVLDALDHLRTLDLPAAVVVSHLCSARGFLKQYDELSGADISEDISLEFAAQCIESAVPDLVQVGVDTLVTLDTPKASELAHELLPRVLEQDVHANSALVAVAAEQLQLPELRSMLLERSAELFIEESDYIGALHAYDAARNDEKLQQAAWDMFETMLINPGAVPDLEAVELDSRALRKAVELSQILYRLVVSVMTEDAELATQCLNALLVLPQPPLKFYPVLVALFCGAPEALSANVRVLLNILDNFESHPAEERAEGEQFLVDMLMRMEWIGQRETAQDAIWSLRRELLKALQC